MGRRQPGSEKFAEVIEKVSEATDHRVVAPDRTRVLAYVDNINYNERKDADETTEHRYHLGDRQKTGDECIDSIAQERQFHVKSPVMFWYLAICILIN